MNRHELVTILLIASGAAMFVLGGWCVIQRVLLAYADLDPYDPVLVAGMYVGQLVGIILLSYGYDRQCEQI